MKKVMILVSAIVLTASEATAAYVFSQKSSGIFEANVEATTFCEITKGGKVILQCSGEGTCSTKYLGYTLTCDGQNM